jgi:hypothetical protein
MRQWHGNALSMKFFAKLSFKKAEKRKKEAKRIEGDHRGHAAGDVEI